MPKFFNKRFPYSWIIAKQKIDVFDAIVRLADIPKLQPQLIQPVGLINGAFDLLHASHLRLLNEARWRSGTLVVLLDSDAKVRRLKGDSRPIMLWGERAAMLFYCGVDLIVEIDTEQEFIDAVEYLQPDFRVLGSEYKGRKSRLPHLHTIYVKDRGPHTSTIIERIYPTTNA